MDIVLRRRLAKLVSRRLSELNNPYYSHAASCNDPQVYDLWAKWNDTQVSLVRRLFKVQVELEVPTEELFAQALNFIDTSL